MYASLKVRNTSAGPTGSDLFYGIDWDQHFPVQLKEKDGSPTRRRIVRSTAKEIFAFYEKHYDEIFLRDGKTHPFFVEPMTAQRLHYYELMGDFFAFLDGDQMVGVFVGNPLDWSTYYLRSTGLVTTHQGLGFSHTFFNLLFSTFKKNGVRRLEADVSPGNFIEIEFLNKRGFRPVGYHASDRWGTMLRFCKFLDSQCEETFLYQLCDGPRLTRKE